MRKRCGKREHKVGFQNYHDIFPQAKPYDLCLAFRTFEPGKFPLERASIKTPKEFEDLVASMKEFGSRILLAVQSTRCCDGNMIFRPLEQRAEEAETYQWKTLWQSRDLQKLSFQPQAALLSSV